MKINYEILICAYYDICCYSEDHHIHAKAAKAALRRGDFDEYDKEHAIATDNRRGQQLLRLGSCTGVAKWEDKGYNGIVARERRVGIFIGVPGRTASGKAASSALKLFFNEGRFVDPSIVASVGDAPTQNYLAIRKMEGLIDGYTYANNDVPKGSAPRIIETTEQGLRPAAQLLRNGRGYRTTNAPKTSGRTTTSGRAREQITPPQEAGPEPAFPVPEGQGAEVESRFGTNSLQKAATGGDLLYFERGFAPSSSPDRAGMECSVGIFSVGVSHKEKPLTLLFFFGYFFPRARKRVKKIKIYGRVFM